jgi:tRNA(adenine34) deaminase
MCAGALFLTRPTALVWGAPDVRHGANGSWIDLFALKHPTHELEIRKGILAGPCVELMRSFFQKRRKEKGGKVNGAESGDEE